MSWLDFANHFLSNQRLHARSWINRTFLGNGVLLKGNLALSFLAFFFSVFVLREANKSPTHKILVGNLREKTTFRSWFPFLLFVYLVTILYCLDIIWSNDLSAPFLCFPSILDRKFSFLPFLPPTLWFRNFHSFLFFAFSHSLIWEFSFFSFLAFSHSFSSEGRDWHSHPGSKFMVS